MQSILNYDQQYYNNGIKYLCGIDEAGRGPLAGPVVAAAVILASGTCGYGPEMNEYVPLGSLGGFVTKGISLQPRAGNPQRRICESSSGVINSFGLENVGVERFLADYQPRIKDYDCVKIVNILGFENLLRMFTF